MAAKITRKSGGHAPPRYRLSFKAGLSHYCLTWAMPKVRSKCWADLPIWTEARSFLRSLYCLGYVETSCLWNDLELTPMAKLRKILFGDKLLNRTLSTNLLQRCAWKRSSFRSPLILYKSWQLQDKSCRKLLYSRRDWWRTVIWQQIAIPCCCNFNA